MDKKIVYYASLVGPLLGIYYRLPFADETANRLALNGSRLSQLWGNIYTEEEVDEAIEKWTGTKFEAGHSMLDFNYHDLVKKLGSTPLKANFHEMTADEMECLEPGK